MQAFQSWKMAVPTLTSRTAQTLRPQLRTTASWILSSGKQQTLASSPRTIFTSQNTTLFSSISTTRPAFPITSFNNNSWSSNCRNANSLTTINQMRSFSSSAPLAGKRATYNPSRRVQKRRHGFLARLKSRTGRLILKRRRLKGRKDLSW